MNPQQKVESLFGNTSGASAFRRPTRSVAPSMTHNLFNEKVAREPVIQQSHTSRAVVPTQQPEIQISNTCRPIAQRPADNNISISLFGGEPVVERPAVVNRSLSSVSNNGQTIVHSLFTEQDHQESNVVESVNEESEHENVSDDE